MSDDSDDWADYESGPFCRHWQDPTDCDEPCGSCGHRCDEHGGRQYAGQEDHCRACGCAAWKDSPCGNDLQARLRDPEKGLPDVMADDRERLDEDFRKESTGPTIEFID